MNKKENLFIFTAGLLILAYVLDYFAGPVHFTVKNHIAFLAPSFISKFPLTAVAVGIRTFGILLGVILLVSLIQNKFFAKAIGLFCLGALVELYTIQQLATGSRMTPTQWTLSLGYFGILLIVPIIFYILRGIFFTVGKKIRKDESSPIDSQA
jgi:hypothetical protein